MAALDATGFCAFSAAGPLTGTDLLLATLTFTAPAAGSIRVVDASGATILEQAVQTGDIFRMCQAKDAAIRKLGAGSTLLSEASTERVSHIVEKIAATEARADKIVFSVMAVAVLLTIFLSVSLANGIRYPLDKIIAMLTERQERILRLAVERYLEHMEALEPSRALEAAWHETIDAAAVADPVLTGLLDERLAGIEKSLQGAAKPAAAPARPAPIDPAKAVEPPMGRSGRRAAARQAYSLSAVDEYGPVIDDIYDFAEAQVVEQTVLGFHGEFAFVGKQAHAGEEEAALPERHHGLDGHLQLAAGAQLLGQRLGRAVGDRVQYSTHRIAFEGFDTGEQFVENDP